MTAEISVNRVELHAAVAKMEPKVGPVNEPLAVNLALKVKELMQADENHPSYPFGEALRYALNELHIPSPKRKSYCAVMGSYFGTHGSRVAARSKKAGKRAKPSPARSASRPPEVVIERDGQLAFRM